MNARQQHPPEEMRANPFDLKQLIAAENDPKQRVLLMLVNTFNENLAANTVAVEDNAREVRGIAQRLDSHLATFEARAEKDDEMRNQGKGAWRVLAWVLGIVQVIGLGIWVRAEAEIKDIHTAIQAGQKADATIEARILAIEAATRTNRQ